MPDNPLQTPPMSADATKSGSAKRGGPLSLAAVLLSPKRTGLPESRTLVLAAFGLLVPAALTILLVLSPVTAGHPAFIFGTTAMLGMVVLIAYQNLWTATCRNYLGADPWPILRLTGDGSTVYWGLMLKLLASTGLVWAYGLPAVALMGGLALSGDLAAGLAMAVLGGVWAIQGLFLPVRLLNLWMVRTASLLAVLIAVLLMIVLPIAADPMLFVTARGQELSRLVGHAGAGGITLVGGLLVWLATHAVGLQLFRRIPGTGAGFRTPQEQKREKKASGAGLLRRRTRRRSRRLRTNFAVAERSAREVVYGTAGILVICVAAVWLSLAVYWELTGLTVDWSVRLNFLGGGIMLIGLGTFAAHPAARFNAEREDGTYDVIRPIIGHRRFIRGLIVGSAVGGLTLALPGSCAVIAGGFLAGQDEGLIAIVIAVVAVSVAAMVACFTLWIATMVTPGTANWRVAAALITLPVTLPLSPVILWNATCLPKAFNPQSPNSPETLVRS